MQHEIPVIVDEVLIATKEVDTEDQAPAKRQKLSSKEVEDIIMGHELSDIHINLAQNLLKSQFPQLKGLQSTLLQGKKSKQAFTDDEIKNKLQIIHCYDRHHWIVATTVTCEQGQVYAFDSLFKTLDDETKATICRLFRSSATSTPKVKVINSPKQEGSKDCGLFSIASATSIAFGLTPNKQKFKQQSMRAHLVKCFENNKLIPFPCIEKL